MFIMGSGILVPTKLSDTTPWVNLSFVRSDKYWKTTLHSTIFNTLGETHTERLQHYMMPYSSCTKALSDTQLHTMRKHTQTRRRANIHTHTHTHKHTEEWRLAAESWVSVCSLEWLTSVTHLCERSKGGSAKKRRAGAVEEREQRVRARWNREMPH